MTLQEIKDLFNVEPHVIEFNPSARYLIVLTLYEDPKKVRLIGEALKEAGVSAVVVTAEDVPKVYELIP